MTTIRVPLPGASSPETTIEVTRSDIEVILKIAETANDQQDAEFWRAQLSRFEESHNEQH